MRALWIEHGRLSLRDDLPIPRPAQGEALVRVLEAGICGTDLELMRGYHRFVGVPGHELVGRVEQGPQELLGQRVTAAINVVCGNCTQCLAGRSTHCEQRQVIGIRGRHGAFAEHLSVPVANLHLVPDTVSDDAAVLAEPLAAALQVRHQVTVSPDDRVLVVGDGRLGQLVALALARSGCRLQVLGRHRRKLALLAERGIDTLIERSPPAGSHDLAVECTGNPKGFAIALEALRPRGTLVLKSTYAGHLELDAAAVVVNEITVVGSRCGCLATALQLLDEGRIQVEHLIDRRFPLADGIAAFAAARAPGVLKVVLEISNETGDV